MTTQLALPSGLTRFEQLPDNAQWKNRFLIPSETSDRLYVVAQRKSNGEWGCDCPSWRVRRTCKHLRSIGLLTNSNHNRGQLK